MTESIVVTKEQQAALLDELDEEMGYSSARHASRQMSTASQAAAACHPSKEITAILNPTNDLFSTTIAKPLSKKLTDNAVEIIKIGNVIAAFVGWMYFMNEGQFDVVLEYAQVCFLAVLMNALDTPDDWRRTFWFSLLTMAGAGWSTMTVHTICAGLPLNNKISWSVMCFFYDSGAIIAAYVSLHHPARYLKTTSFLEIDLLLYLVSLNALCIFPIAHFNSNLHMLLDIRMVVLLYTGLFRPVDKMSLLRRKSLLFIMFCILLFFVLVANPDPTYQLLGSIVNIGVGLTLSLQALYRFYVKYPRIRQAQAAEVAWEQEQLHSLQQKQLDAEIQSYEQEEQLRQQKVASVTGIMATKRISNPHRPTIAQPSSSLPSPSPKQTAVPEEEPEHRDMSVSQGAKYTHNQRTTMIGTELTMTTSQSRATSQDVVSPMAVLANTSGSGSGSGSASSSS